MNKNIKPILVFASNEKYVQKRYPSLGLYLFKEKKFYIWNNYEIKIGTFSDIK